MIDLKQLRENPSRFKDGAAKKGVPVDIDRLVALDEQRRSLMAEQESLRAEQGKISKDLGPQMGRLTGQLKSASPADKDRLQRELDELKARPAALKGRIQSLDDSIAAIEPEFNEIYATQNRAVEQAEGVVPGLRYVDIYSTLGKGKYSDDLKIDGRRVLARQPDGVHFTRDGAVAPVRLILKEMEKDFPALEDSGP